METMQARPKREGFQTSGGAQGASQSPEPARGMNGPATPVIDAAAEPAPGIESSPPPEPVETWPIKVKLLHRPIRNNQGELVKELTFREPTGGDINRCGNPCRINLDGDVVIDEKKMSLIMANLSGILSPLLDGMDPRDWNSCAYRLRNFFLPEVAAW
jgi:tail assembly chaperone E/41/14-like protein